MIQKTWLPSRCLAMDGRYDSDIPASSCTPQYKFDASFLLVLRNIKELSGSVIIFVSLAYIPYFEGLKLGLCDHLAVFVSVFPPINF
jgi:hypothetical protein